MLRICYIKSINFNYMGRRQRHAGRPPSSTLIPADVKTHGGITSGVHTQNHKSLTLNYLADIKSKKRKKPSFGG